MPGKPTKPKTYHIKTFGCQMNFSDSERLASFLEKMGISPAQEIARADFAVFNTCGVRQSAENRVFSLIHNLRKNNPAIKIALTGCLADRKDVQKKLNGKTDLFFPIKELGKFENWITESCPEACLPADKVGNKKLKISARKATAKNQNYLSIKPKYKNPKSALVPVMTGCNNFCSYCVVPYARGRETSRPAEEIFTEVEDLAKNGCEEITLLGQNVNSYSCKKRNLILQLEKWELEINLKLKIENLKFKRPSTGYNALTFPLLLNALAKTYPKIHWRFLTSHPKDFSEQLMHAIAQNKNISKEIHLPVQSGSNKILTAMNRPYTQKHYLSLIEKARKIIPDVSFTTDVIVGFPGETQKDFLETAKVFKKVSFTQAYVNKYSPRPGTTAFQLGDPIPWEEKKRREKELRKLVGK